MTTPTDSQPLIVAVDQGTSSTKAIAMTTGGQIIATAKVAVECQHPQAGWVQQDGNEIWRSVITCLNELAQQLGEQAGAVQAIGLSTQRESAVAWNKHTGELLSPIIGWQDRRTTQRAQQLSTHAEQIREITGLPLDPMFSALKFEWLYANLLTDIPSEQIALGTVDSWLMYNLTGEHRIELGNASRTQLLDVHQGQWSVQLLALFGINVEHLPRLARSNEPSKKLRISHNFHPDVHIAAVLADSHAALAGHGINEPGQVKVTYGTGSSVMGLRAPGQSAPAGLVDTIAWATDQVVYASEGNILSTGATMMWLAQLLGKDVHQLWDDAAAAPADHGLNLVPAFAGLGAPWWDESAVGVLSGFTLGTTPSQIARAAAESIALQIEDLLAALGGPEQIHADGGPSQNPWLMQLQADLSQRAIVSTQTADLSAFGVAELAGISAGLITAPLTRHRQHYQPQLDPDSARRRQENWQQAIQRSRGQQTHPTQGAPS